MTDIEFMETVQTHYARVLEKTGDKNRAHREAEKFRSSLIVSLAQRAADKLEK